MSIWTSPHTLRYYERAGLLEPVGRNGSGHRRYREADLELIRFLTRLRATGMPIREVRRYAELMQAGDATNTECAVPGASCASVDVRVQPLRAGSGALLTLWLLVMFP